jgi:hypothetical protein
MAILQTQPRGVPIGKDPRSDVQAFLDRFARALVAGDGETLGTLFELPAIVISEDTVVALTTQQQTAEMFGQAAAAYQARGIVDTRANLIDLERVGSRILIATVRWPHLDSAHHEVAAEESDYTLRRDDSGALKIRSVLMRGLEAPLPQPRRPRH